MVYGKKVFRTYYCMFFFILIECGWVIQYMELLTLKQFDEVYQLFEEAFIPAELRPYDRMKDLFSKNEFKIYILKEKVKIIGAMIAWEFDDYIYLENFAVDSSLRGNGIGGTILEYMKKVYHNKTIVLEVEEPVDDLTLRRIEFYKRHQWVLNDYHFIQPLLRENVDDVHLMLMSYPCVLNHQQCDKIKDELTRKVYKQK